MRQRYPFVPVPASAATALVVLLSLIAPAPVGLAQSAPPPLTPWRGLIDHASVTATGEVPTFGVEVGHHAISGDGRFVVMQSLADTLVANDLNWAQDIFLRDRQTGTTTRLSVSTEGGDSNGFSDQASISTDGRHVAFTSSATNLVEGDTNGFNDVFVRDLALGRTVRVSVATDGTQADSYAYYPSISANGRFVAFVSDATTLAGRPQYAPMQVYVHDRDADGNGTFDEQNGTLTTLDSVSSSGDAADNYSHHVRISGTGRFVLFESSATNLDPVGNPNAANHVYLRDRQAGTTTLIDRAMTGGPSAWGTDYRTADMTDDGRYITYATYSQDIVPGSTDWKSQVLRYDTQGVPPAERTTVVTALPDGTVGNGYSFDSALSADGRYVAFRSTSTNLALPPQPQDNAAIFVRDMVSGTFTRIDVLDSGEGFDHSYPYSPSISADATAVAFMSDARNAVGGQYTFGSQHTFVATAFSVSPSSATVPMAGGTGTIEVNTLPVSGWNAVSLDTWIVLMAGDGFAAGPRTVEYSVEANESGILRTGRIRLGSKIVTIEQEGDGDTTPPVITPTVTGTLGANGWYTSKITVQWSVTDPESEIVSISGCYNSTFTSDFIYASPMCEATSHGGTATVSVPLRRDTTAPAIAINAPLPVFYRTGTSLFPSYSCSEPNGYAGVASCTTTAGPGPLDTATPGRHTFTVNATDLVGNAGAKTVEYIVGTGACVAQPAALRAWWRFNGNMYDTVDRLYASPSVASGWFEDAVAGQGWVNGAASNYLDTLDESRLLMSSAVTVALWVKPIAHSGQSGTLVTKPAQYRIARYLDGTLRWAFSHSGGYTWVNTGAIIPAQQWSHVAVAYDNGLVKSYLNGTLVHTQQLSGSLVSTGNPNASLTIGGRADLAATLHGTLDDVQIYDRAVSAAEIESIALAGSGSLCVPNGSTLTVSAPSTIGYGSTFRVTAVLRDADGNPLANRQVWLNSHVAPGGFAGGVSGTTDASGSTSADLPVSSSAALGPYARAASAVFEGDVSYRESSAETPATLVAGTPVVTWPAPAPIVYGNGLGAQLNASASVAGAFSYSPAAGTMLGAGTHTLSVTFTPDDQTRWAPTTKTTTLIVDKAAPIVTATGGTFTYDKQPHPGSGTATGVLGESLSPVQLTYDGASETPPVDAGAHSVRATFAGSANYLAGNSTDVPLTIDKAVPTVEIGGNSLFYTGQPRQVVVTVRGVESDALNPYTVLYNGSASLPVEAGTYAVLVQFDGSANYAAATGNGTLVINKTTPIMSIGAENVTYDGQPHGASAAVVGVNNEPLTPVVITYNGSASVPTNAGEYAVEARYEGSANYTGVTRTTTLTIFKKAPHLQWFPGPASIFYGTALGQEQFGATADVPGTFNYSPGAGTVLNSGTHTLTAAFTPTDQVNYTTGSITATLSVTRATPGITWAQPAPIVYGAALGAAQFNATAGVPGTFTYSPPAGTVLAAGTHVVSVTFVPADSANYNGSSTGRVLTVAPAPLTVAANNAAKAFGAPLPPFSPATAGFVNGDSMASLSGSLTLTTSATASSPVGSYPIVPQGVSSSNYAIAFVAGALTVVKANTAVAAVSSPNPSGFNQPVSYTATIAVVAPGAGSPAGSVQFFDGGTLVGTAALVAGSASLTTNGLAAGSHTITANYSGDASFAASSGTTALTVRSASASSTTTLTSSRNPASPGQSVTFRATVSAPSGTNGGIVEFYDGATLIGTGVLSSGLAQLSTTALAAGGHAISARYVGSASVPPSASLPLAQTIGSQSKSSSVAVSASPSPAALGNEVAITAVVTGGQQKAPTGQVLFLANGQVLGQVTATVTGNVTSTAVMHTAALPRGTHTIVVVYLSDPTFRASTRSTTVTVN
jgi:hypothetical protein